MASPLSSASIASCSASSSTLHFSCRSSSRRLGFDPFTGNGLGLGLRGRKHFQSFHGTLSVGVRASLQDFGGSVDATSHFVSTTLPELAVRAEGFLYTIADAAVSTDATAAQTVTQQNRDWLSGLSDTLESVLKVLKQGLETLHVPYSYGFAIILLTVLVKAATLPLSKQQVESSLAMQNLAPKIKAIQQRYAGNQERIQLETARLYKQAGVNPLAGCLPTLATIPVWIGLYRALSNVANEGLLTEGFFWIPSLSGPTTIAARQSGSGISWLFPFVDGAPPLGWSDTLAYLVLPTLLIASQYVSMQIMQPPQTDDPNQKNTQVILKFLPLMIGYFSLSVPSGLSLYWLTNNILSTGQQVWLRKMGGAKVPVAKDGGDIISAGQALRTTSETPVIEKRDRRGEKFRQLKKEEALKKKAQRQNVAASAGDSESEGDISSDDESIDISSTKDSLEEIYSRTQTEGRKSTTSSGKRSKRKRAV